MIKFFPALLFLFILGCNTSKESSHKKFIIESENVSFIILEKEGVLDTVCTLNDVQKNDFIKGWNNSKFEGFCKFIPEYSLEVLYKGVKSKYFVMSENLIKGPKGITYSLPKGFVNNLWRNGDKITLPFPPEESTLMMQYLDTIQMLKRDTVLKFK